MGGSSCLGLSFIEFKIKWVEHRVRACGLRPQLVHLDSDTAIHCWVPLTTKPEAGVWSVPGSTEEKKPALLLIHGFGPNALLAWENQIPAFVQEFDVYVPDLLFFGNSTTQVCDKRWTEAFQAECLMRLLRILGVHNQVQVVGTSYGGMVAFRMAELYPNLVNKVVFSGSGICMSPNNDYEILARYNLSHVSEVLLPSSAKQMRIALTIAHYKTPRIPDFILRDFIEVLYEENRDERKRLLDDMVFGTPEAFPLPHLTQEKFLVLWGKHDEVFNISLAHELQNHLGTSRAEIEVMKNCGHVPQMEDSKEYNRIILNFLQSAPAKSTKDSSGDKAATKS